MPFLQNLFGAGAGGQNLTGLVTNTLKPVTSAEEIQEQQKTYQTIVVSILLFVLMFFALLIWGLKK